MHTRLAAARQAPMPLAWRARLEAFAVGVRGMGSHADLLAERERESIGDRTRTASGITQNRPMIIT